MSSKPWPTRIAFWVAVCALLLKAAVPMLATASARSQGKALVEVCTVYGVATVAVDAPGDLPVPGPDHGATHGGEHCALSALMSLPAPGQAHVLALPVAQLSAWVPQAAPSPQVPDACTAWAARLRHGPPALV